jgi:two-component system, chemotaxis family, protein-glutamate methylesterase/glutaminase
VNGLRVLVVDDSALVRQMLTGLLGSAGMEVQSVADPLFARERMLRWTPDVIVLDLEMPRMDGLTFLRLLRAENGPPVVVCSGAAGDRSVVALRALAEGATDVIARPRIGVRAYLEESVVLLTDAILAAAQARRRRRHRTSRPTAKERPTPRRGKAREIKLVAIGASTGGTEALHALLVQLPAELPPIVVVQHMPPGFTAALATRLDKVGALRVKEAEAGDPLLPGHVLIAPGGRHLVVRNGHVDVIDGPLVSRHRPSVDVLFQSVARAAGASALGVILTGMGEDGRDGMLSMHRLGAPTIAQDEASCAVFGMPKAAIDAGIVDDVVPLARIAHAIAERCRG